MLWVLPLLPLAQACAAGDPIACARVAIPGYAIRTDVDLLKEECDDDMASACRELGDATWAKDRKAAIELYRRSCDEWSEDSPSGLRTDLACVQLAVASPADAPQVFSDVCLHHMDSDPLRPLSCERAHDVWLPETDEEDGVRYGFERPGDLGIHDYDHVEVQTRDKKITDPDIADIAVLPADVASSLVEGTVSGGRVIVQRVVDAGGGKAILCAAYFERKDPKEWAERARRICDSVKVLPKGK